MRTILFALLATTACSTNNGMTGDDDSGGGGGGVSDTDKQQDYDDVASSIAANLSAGELATMLDAVNMAYGRMPEGYTITQKTDYQLLDGTRGGLTVEYKLYCRDAADAVAPCDGAENHAHVRPTYSGSITDGSDAIDGVQRTTSWIVRSTNLPTPFLGGTGTNSFTSHLGTGDYDLVVTDSMKDVVFASTPTTPTGGGTITSTVNVQRTRPSSDPAQRSFGVTASILVTASDTGALTLDGTRNYTLTFSTGAVTNN